MDAFHYSRAPEGLAYYVALNTVTKKYRENYVEQWKRKAAYEQESPCIDRYWPPIDRSIVATNWVISYWFGKFVTNLLEILRSWSSTIKIIEIIQPKFWKAVWRHHLTLLSRETRDINLQSITGWYLSFADFLFSWFLWYGL